MPLAALKRAGSMLLLAAVPAAALAAAALARAGAQGGILLSPRLVYALAAGYAGLAAAVAAIWLRCRRLAHVSGSAREALRNLRSEREGLVQRLHALERHLERLTVIREIHAAGNIPGREQRLRALLEALAAISGGFRVGLYRISDGASAPVALFEQQDRSRIFVFVEDGCDPWAEEALRVTDAKAEQTATGSTIIASLEKAGRKLAAVEIELRGRTRKEPAHFVLGCLQRMRPEAAAVDLLIQKPVSTLQPAAGASRPHCILQPLWTEDRLIGGVRVEIRHDALPEARLRVTADALAEAALHAALALKKEEHRERALKDGLTGLYQKRVLTERLEALASRVRRQQDRSFALVMLDIDHFKRVNDTHGHQTGDMVLERVADILRLSLRDEDQGFRYGGEELAVILKSADRAGALAFAERVRRTVERTDFRSPRGERVPLTISAGVSLHAPGLPADDLVAAADAALYRAKRAGRNRVCFLPAETRVIGSRRRKRVAG